jgi:hypothetical protein
MGSDDGLERTVAAFAEDEATVPPGREWRVRVAPPGRLGHGRPHG